MNKNIKNKDAFSVIISLMIIGFLLVVTTGIYKLVLFELKDNRGVGNYLKAYSAAEGAGELALLKIKKESYAYDYNIDDSINSRSILLAENSLDKSSFHKKKDVYISYDFNYKVNNFDGSLAPGGFDIIPLFFLDDSGEKKATSLDLSVSTSNSSNLSWNIVGKSSGISGAGNISDLSIGKGRKITGEGKNAIGEYIDFRVGSFLSNSEQNYLILLNTDPSSDLKYNLTVPTGEYFIKPRTDITSSAVVGDFRQNLKIHLDNTKYLGIMKYSIFGK